MKQAIVFGAGNIGRGFIGQLFSESGYRVSFIDVDQALIAALNGAGSYRLQTVFNDDGHEYRIEPVAAIDARQTEAVAAAIAAAEIGATAVGANVLKHLVPNLLAGMRQRRAAGAAPLNLILCENLKGAAAAMRQWVNAQAEADLVPYLDTHLGLVDTVIGRMVPLPTPEMREKDITLIRVEPYKELPVDRSQFLGPIPTIAAMMPEAHFGRFTARKLYIHNCGHALLAYAGYLYGYEYGWQALEDATVRQLLDRGLAESKAGIVAKYGASAAWLQAHIDDLFVRFGNRALGDTVFRLGRDPLRKLHSSDRLVGAARVVEAAGASPRHLALGIAVALFFDPADDPAAQQLQQSLRDKGPAITLQEIAGIAPDEPLGRQVLADYESLKPEPAAVLRQWLGARTASAPY